MERIEQLSMLPSALLPWFRENGRPLPWRSAPSPYHVWLSEIMLQQTRIEAVKPYYARFLQEIPDIPSLAKADPEKLQKLWEGLGYYSRVRNLHSAAQQIMEKHGGQFPADYGSIRALKGIGDYTAGAIASICFSLPVPAVDGNVLRVIARITADERPVTDGKIKDIVREELAAVYPKENCGDFTEALMELGETVCIPSGIPSCETCPCFSFCKSRDGGWENYPVRAPKKARRKESITVFLLSCGEKTAVRKRSSTGLLAGLWEYPNCSGTLSAQEAFRMVEGLGCAPAEAEDAGVYSHIFTHVEWDMQCYRLLCRRMPEELTWVDDSELKERISLPTAFRKIRK